MLRLEQLDIRLGGFALRGIDLDLHEGEYLVLLGASGTGKTVLLETLAGLHRPAGGCIRLDGRDITMEPIQSRSMALVYQDQALFPHMTVRQNVAYSLAGRGLGHAAREEILGGLATVTGIADLMGRRPATLSGGEAQRVALARALARHPRYLLLDEPLASLDCDARSGLRSLLRNLHRSGHTILHVTHDFEEALALATRVAVLEDGRIVQAGPPAEVFRHPRSRFVARFTGIRNVLRGRLESCDEDGMTMGRFHVEGLTFSVMTEDEGGRGCLMFRGEDVYLAVERPRAELPNLYPGRVRDLVPARGGVEVEIDIGIAIHALLDEGLVRQLGLAAGREVWTSLSSTAGRFIGEGS
ncbi:MAG: ABC transporter ATP-binding protein [bacterium]|nr:ABC transporter ATP-binding protein [bacterium]